MYSRGRSHERKSWRSLPSVLQTDGPLSTAQSAVLDTNFCSDKKKAGKRYREGLLGVGAASNLDVSLGADDSKPRGERCSTACSG